MPDRRRTVSPGQQLEPVVQRVSRPVPLTVETVAGGGATLTARARTSIDRYAFGLTNARGMTGRRLHLTLDVVAVHA
ncbi:hypothetical protein ACFP2T_06505 [Plantactinospora solaniradicis]|uniref:YceI family protein n=1 Tax=Plantactinospora solaniradicis TaxID=1723736 RepID=A0ABW1K342_9ACTN